LEKRLSVFVLYHPVIFSTRNFLPKLTNLVVSL